MIKKVHQGNPISNDIITINAFLLNPCKAWAQTCQRYALLFNVSPSLSPLYSLLHSQVLAIFSLIFMEAKGEAYKKVTKLGTLTQVP